MKALGRNVFALLALGILGGCLKLDEFGSWKYVSNTERVSLVTRAKVDQSALIFTCVDAESPRLMLATKGRLAHSSPRRTLHLRAGSKAAILQSWTIGDNLASPETRLEPGLVHYVGDEKQLIIRTQDKRDPFEYTFDVAGMPEAFAMMTEVCKRQASESAETDNPI